MQIFVATPGGSSLNCGMFSEDATFKLRPKVKELWLAALRSNDYVQGDGNLRRINRDGETLFCCLGVLCNIHAQQHPEIAAGETNHCTYLESSELLPLAVADWAVGSRVRKLHAGFTEDDAIDFVVKYNGGHYGDKDYDTVRLSALNDEGVSFAEIADIIEAQM